MTYSRRRARRCTGVSTGRALEHPPFEVDGRSEGALSDDGRILATYVHGLFDHPKACTALLVWAGLEAPQETDYRALVRRSIERLADVAEAHLDIERLLEAAR